MGQYRYTGLSGGGPTYINDPRVDEAVALGQLLLQRQQAANAQADRLFARQRDVADFDERRRQFNEEQKRLGDAQKMQQADADRRQTLAQQELELRQAAQQEAARQFGVEQAGRGEDRLFARSEASRQGSQFRSEQQRLAQQERDRLAAEEAARRERAAADVLNRADDATKTEQELASRETIARLQVAAQKEATAGANARANEQTERAYELQRRKDEADRKAAEIKAAADERRVLGDPATQRAEAIRDRVSRFRDFLDDEIKKGNASGEGDQQRLITRAYEASLRPSIDDNDVLGRTKARLALEGEAKAQADAEIRAIVAERFPTESRFTSQAFLSPDPHLPQFANDFLQGFNEQAFSGLNRVTSPLPDNVVEAIAALLPFIESERKKSAAQEQADRLFAPVGDRRPKPDTSSAAGRARAEAARPKRR